MTSAPDWKGNVLLYAHPQVVTFDSEEDLRKALKAFRNPEHSLYRVPRDLVEDRTIVLPPDALRYLDESAIRYTASEVQSVGSLSSGARSKLQR